MTDEVQKPVAWMYEQGADLWITYQWSEVVNDATGKITPLYTAPPARQPLTDSEIDHTKVLDGHKMDTPTFLRAFARAVERHHGIKGEQHE